MSPNPPQQFGVNSQVKLDNRPIESNEVEEQDYANLREVQIEILSSECQSDRMQFEVEYNQDQSPLRGSTGKKSISRVLMQSAGCYQYDESNNIERQSSKLNHSFNQSQSSGRASIRLSQLQKPSHTGIK
jgi:hypothetical protein